MNHLVLVGGIGLGLLLLVVLGFWFYRRRPRKLNPNHFSERWQLLQKHCATRKTWPKALIEADDLLAEALKRRHYKGKTAGERMVAAQHELTSNESVWFAHKYRNQIVNQDVRTLKKQDVFRALAGFRQALKDIGALE